MKTLHACNQMWYTNYQFILPCSNYRLYNASHPNSFHISNQTDNTFDVSTQYNHIHNISTKFDTATFHSSANTINTTFCIPTYSIKHTLYISNCFINNHTRIILHNSCIKPNTNQYYYWFIIYTIKSHSKSTSRESSSNYKRGGGRFRGRRLH